MDGAGKFWEKSPRHYAYLPTPVWGWVASASETEGGGYKNGADHDPDSDHILKSFTTSG